MLVVVVPHFTDTYRKTFLLLVHISILEPIKKSAHLGQQKLFLPITDTFSSDKKILKNNNDILLIATVCDMSCRWL